MARGTEITGFFTFHPVVPLWVPLGTGKQAGNSLVMSIVYLIILLIQVIVIFSLFLFRALILCVSPILPFTADREHFHWCDNSGYTFASSIGKHKFSVLWIEGQFGERFVSFLMDQVVE